MRKGRAERFDDDAMRKRLLALEREVDELRAALSAMNDGVPYFIGSLRRTKFHRPDCPWAIHLHEGNSEIYASRVAAIADGRKPCGTCKS